MLILRRNGYEWIKRIGIDQQPNLVMEHIIKRHTSLLIRELSRFLVGEGHLDDAEQQLNQRTCILLRWVHTKVVTYDSHQLHQLTVLLVPQEDGILDLEVGS